MPRKLLTQPPGEHDTSKTCKISPFSTGFGFGASAPRFANPAQSSSALSASHGSGSPAHPARAALTWGKMH